VHEHVEPLLRYVGRWPTVGTPEWCALAADDRAKVAALYDAARHHALRLELNQEALADASKAVSAAADWKAVALEMQRRRGVYIPWAVDR
jgi:uncharacterized protein DUF2742